MKPARSIRARLIVGAAVVLVAFMAIAGLAVQRAHEDGVRSAHFARLQGTVYLLLAAAELDTQGALAMPAALTEPRLTLPASGLYASITNLRTREAWRSPSAVGTKPPFLEPGAVGDWRFEPVQGPGARYLAVGYSVKWSAGAVEAPLALSVVEETTQFDREIATFGKTLWSWLGAAAVLLLLSQTVLLEWGLAPLRQVTREIRRVEDGEHPEVQGHYPEEIAGLTGNINALIRQERVRQTRYREALSFLAHSLKTPLAVLRNSTHEPALLPVVVTQQVARMDDIVQHQLARAAAGGAALFAPPIALLPVAQRIRDSLAKVYADKSLRIAVDCDAALKWRLAEGDAFEMLGNLMDNAAKWARSQLAVRLWRDGDCLHISIEDDGPGFTDTQAVLQLHVRGDEHVPGHGVGLAVVNELVKTQEGELDLGASALGGAQVNIRLPRR